MKINLNNCWEKIFEILGVNWPENLKNTDTECVISKNEDEKLRLKFGKKQNGITCKILLLQGKAEDTIPLLSNIDLPPELHFFQGGNQRKTINVSKSIKSIVAAKGKPIHIGFIDKSFQVEQIIPFGNDQNFKKLLQARLNILQAYINEFVEKYEQDTKKGTHRGSTSPNDNTTKHVQPTDKFVPLKYPITVKLNLSSNSINYSPELNNLKQFGDIQCRYMLNDREEMLCFVLQEVKKNEQCIFGIKKNILQKRISEQYFRLDDNQGNGVFLENAKDAIDALPLTYGMTSSWAVGPKTKNGIPVKASKKNYSKILHDWIQYESFTERVVDNDNKPVEMSECECASLNDFNPSVVLLGQNWSDTILDVCHNNMRELWEVYWQNFQPGNAANGNGGLLRDAIEGTILEKAYMTDFDKGNIETDSYKAFQKSMERKKINASILFNELQDLACLKKNDSNVSNIIICVWGTGQWDNVPNDIKYGKNKNWGKYEFRLVGEHYSNQNGELKLRKQAIADFSASITWQQALFNAYNRKYGHKGVNNVLVRHLCYIISVIIHNEIYRESNDKGGFGGVGRKFGDGSVKKLYDETQKQTLAIDFKLPELSILTKYIKSKINKEIIECLCEPNPAERGKKAYDVLIKNNDSISKSISMFLESVSAFLDSELKTLLRTKLP